MATRSPTIATPGLSTPRASHQESLGTRIGFPGSRTNRSSAMDRPSLCVAERAYTGKRPLPATMVAGSGRAIIDGHPTRMAARETLKSWATAAAVSSADYQTGNRDEDHGPNKGDHDTPDHLIGSRGEGSDHNPANEGADPPQDQVTNKPGPRAHHRAGQPSGDQTNHDPSQDSSGREPYGCKHLLSPSGANLVAWNPSLHGLSVLILVSVSAASPESANRPTRTGKPG